MINNQDLFMTTEKLSVLLKLALEDLKKCAAEPQKYKIDMADWVEMDGEVCHVCLAGAVAAQRFNLSDYRIICTENIDLMNRMSAINVLRTGDVGDALMYLQKPTAKYWRHPLDRRMPKYGHAVWWVAMERLIIDLEAAGL